MGANFSRIKNWVAEVLTYGDLNAEFNNILNNFDPDGIDDASANATAMQATADPYPGDPPAVSLATSLRGEIQRLRYVIKQLTGEAQWYIDPDYNVTQLQPLDATLTALAGLTITEGSLISGTGTDAFSVLAKGTAGQTLQINAGATAPAWATPFAIGTFTRDNTAAGGDVAYDTAGFKPSVVIFLSTTASSANWSVGIDNGTLSYSIVGLSATTNGPDATYAIACSDGTNAQRGYIKSMDTSGFTITWVKTNSPTGTNTVYYLALR